LHAVLDRLHNQSLAGEGESNRSEDL